MIKGEYMKKTVWAILTGVLFTLLITMSVAAVMESQKNREISLRLDNSLKSSMQQAVSDMRTIETDLSKLMITVNEKTASQMLSTIAIKSDSCSRELAKLPIIATGMQNTLKFTNQLSSYCVTALHGYTDGNGFPENFDAQVKEFFHTAGGVNEQLAKAENDVLSGNISLLDVGEQYDTDGVFGSIAEDMTEYPSVIFDGPFSDGQARTTPKTERAEISIDDASKALEGLSEGFEFSYEVNGTVPSYAFQSENMTAFVTKKGGLLLSLISSREIGEATVSLESAAQKAREYSDKMQGGECDIVWQEDYGNYCVFNFAPEIEGTVIYPDIFKVTVALDNGEIIGFEGKSFYMSNHERNIPDAIIQVESARERLKDGFKIQTERKCIISVNEKEELCYEFFGSYDSLDYAVYISAIDGNEKTSFRIINTDTGKMVI